MRSPLVKKEGPHVAKGLVNGEQCSAEGIIKQEDSLYRKEENEGINKVEGDDKLELDVLTDYNVFRSLGVRKMASRVKRREE